MGRILTVDRGNTAAKVSVFDGFTCLESIICDSLSIESVVPVLERYSVDGAAYCCVGHNDVRFIESLRLMLDSPLLLLTHSVALPFRIDYTETLGLDRIAAAAGAMATCGSPVLVADAGTALTLDVVAEKAFKGGNISPGMALRFKALHDFTNALPLVTYKGECPDFGNDTESAIRAGVINGLVAEIGAAFRKASVSYPDLRLLLTGGDARILARHLDIDGIIVDNNIVGKGLVSIFEYNFKS